ncbi:glycosyltransferase family 4 protein [Salinimicrobium tongyeongense]|uniref:Glycosyltransferase family 4 protein n=1 Tax=Salinimicrobium tongyeongense TaxID=2809707 RepID=A0ABY6NS76_9FLAO|nr:glycosyltransferase family 4 protein [Salinimicrobium tongyeongense]UZH55511.1 glycosyltransferase family 4 protein [Salinimicrobium tongyeongense]
MRILIVIDSLGAGGAERSTAVFCEYLESKKIYFDILCLDKKEVGFQQELLSKGYSISFLKNIGLASQVKEIAEVIKNGNYDLVHSILFRSNIRTRLSKLFVNFNHLESLVNTTYSIERFSDERVNKYGLRLYKLIDQVTAKKGVDHFHSITKAVKEHYVKELGLNPQQITVVPRGRKPLLLNYQEKAPTFSSTIKIINVGRHEFQKGQIYLLRAVKILISENYNLHLKILGRNGTATNQLTNYIKENNLEEHVSLIGFTNDVPTYLKEADLFVFPSLYEGLGGALIEAQSAGLPVACNDISVLHEVVEKNKNAKFFNVHDINSVVTALRFFLDSKDNCEEYGRASLKNFYEKFLESNNNKRLLDLYTTLIQ